MFEQRLLNMAYYMYHESRTHDLAADNPETYSHNDIQSTVHLQLKLQYSQTCSKDHLCIKTTCLIKTTFYRSPGVYFSCYWPSIQRPLMYENHILLVPSVVFIHSIQQSHHHSTPATIKYKLRILFNIHDIRLLASLALKSLILFHIGTPRTPISSVHAQF